jgi:signal transduction histidine kinase
MAQILINLLTNSIKFIETEKEKHFEVRYGAKLSPPRSTNNTVAFLDNIHRAPQGSNTLDVTREEAG